MLLGVFFKFCYALLWSVGIDALWNVKWVLTFMPGYVPWNRQNIYQEIGENLEVMCALGNCRNGMRMLNFRIPWKVI